ncbi:hypothetical protein WUBG_05988, partial [Wuchereria bancrofti]
MSLLVHILVTAAARLSILIRGVGPVPHAGKFATFCARAPGSHGIFPTLPELTEDLRDRISKPLGLRP